jgi:GrpB-like predicted nucleotidyltransferase (UPF0157 family)
MLRTNEESYLQTIPEDKITNIQPFNPQSQVLAEGVIKEIRDVFPDLGVFFGGASALGIAGQNDVDLNLMSVPEEYPKYIPGLVKLFSEPAKSSPNLVKWEFARDEFEVELYLTDRNSPELQRHMRVYELLRDHSDYKKEYEQIKIACNGLPFREYMRRKYEFFNKILGK